MSTRFVSAGSEKDQALATDQDKWSRAKEEVEHKRNTKPIDVGKQEGGKSLYEVLQANKAAKQEAFEEATKVRNQFRALDDSEIEFLDSVRQSEIAKEKLVKNETAEQLDLFRKQQSAAAHATLETEDKTEAINEDVDAVKWTNTRKRRRDDGNHREDKRSRLKQPNGSEQLKVQKVNGNVTDRTDVNRLSPPINSSKSKPAGLGLGLSGYDSDDD